MREALGGRKVRKTMTEKLYFVDGGRKKYLRSGVQLRLITERSRRGNRARRGQG